MNHILLVLGAGPGIGSSVASYFTEKGYSVAVAARSLADRKQDKYLELHADLADPASIPALFRKVENELGGPPSVVVYNAASRTIVSADDPLSSLSKEDWERDVNVNFHSAFAAAQQAVHGFSLLPVNFARTFIYTGNKLNVMADPSVFAFGAGRAGAVHLFWDCSIAYRTKGFKFYYTDERMEDGAPARELMDPTARGSMYYQLCQREDQGPWHYTFTKAVGYKDFRSIDKPWDVVI